MAPPRHAEWWEVWIKYTITHGLLPVSQALNHLSLVCRSWRREASRIINEASHGILLFDASGLERFAKRQCVEWKSHDAPRALEILFGYQFAGAIVDNPVCNASDVSTSSTGIEAQTTTTPAVARPGEFCYCRPNELFQEECEERLPLVTQSDTVRFININRTCAVFLRTQPLDLQQPPFALFCVAKASEDGCFLSTPSFSFGHQEPPTEQHELVSLSPICLRVYETIQSTTDAPCRCRMKGICDHVYSTLHDTYENDSPGSIIRGRTLPGDWHLYVLVVSPTTVELRVDGRRENCQPYDAPITIPFLCVGSDVEHDMSLNSSESDGDTGAIAAWGCVPFVRTKDIECLERNLLQAYPRITVAQDTSSSEDENQVVLRANALFGGQHSATPIPLRYAVRTRFVTWLDRQKW